MSGPAVPVTEPLDLVALDTERFVAGAGWDQAPRLFALVPTAALLEAQPELASGLSAADLAPGALAAVEQEDLPEHEGLEDLLHQIAWPPAVTGCALAVERLVVPPEAERDLPTDPANALAALAAHPARQDVRLLVAVLRDGAATCLLRQRDHDNDDDVAVGENIAPGLLDALRQTLRD